VPSNLTKHFNFASEEAEIYKLWEESKSFQPKINPKTFTMAMPPPNITGKLHMGHALFTTLQDTIIRSKRMLGYETLWIPGTDHAGLATHEKIIEQLNKNNLSITKENYMTLGKGWENDVRANITHQLRCLGTSCDWSREKYTLSAEHTLATIEAFNRCHNAGILYRKDNQWWLDMSGLAKELLDRHSANELEIIPEDGGKTFRHFLKNIEPWCLSRQIWWGHQIPAWQDTSGKWIIARNEEEAKKQTSLPLTRDSDSLDTWFSSAIWPLSILGWPNETHPDYERYYPTNLIETADDIIFFWCARMLMMSLLLTKKLSFNKIYLHGIIRDKHGRKMAKSLGNGIDPLETINRYGCDALRLALLENNTAGQDTRLDNNKFDSAARFMNKLWQASRFCLRHLERNPELKIIRPEGASENNLKLLELLDQCQKSITSHYETLNFREAAFEFRHFFKDEFCDWFIESQKDKLYKDDLESLNTLFYALQTSLKLAHPMIPFITERIWSHFNDGLLIGQTF
jgi:valyl-tRNA synthetase